MALHSLEDIQQFLEDEGIRCIVSFGYDGGARMPRVEIKTYDGKIHFTTVLQLLRKMSLSVLDSHSIVYLDEDGEEYKP